MSTADDGKARAPPAQDVAASLDRQHQRLDPRCVLADTKRRNQSVDGELAKRLLETRKASPHPTNPWSVVTF